MPEGHVTHRLARELVATFGTTPLRVTSPQGRFAESSALLDGGALAGADAVGKHLLIDFDPGTVWVHLGLIGKFRFSDEFPAPNPGTLRLRLDDGAEYLARMVNQVTNPVRWDLCTATMRDRFQGAERAGIVEFPPAGTLVGIAKRELKGTPTRAVKAPADLDGLDEL